VTVSSSDYVNWLYVVSGAVLCVRAEFYMLATNRTEAVVNESRAELYMYIEESSYVSGVDRTCRETCVLVEFSVRKRERDDIRIGTYLCKYSDA